MTIDRVRAREILDSRGRPAVEAEVILEDGTIGRAACPSGVSTGRHEAHELRDGDPTRYRGRGVGLAVANVNQIISPELRGLDPADQSRLDQMLIALDGTPNKRRLGANATVAVSLAAARAASAQRKVPLYRHLAELVGNGRPRIPLPMVNIISGGLHAGGHLDIQDVMAMPIGSPTFANALEIAVEVHARVGDRVRETGYPPLVADEGGWAPTLRTNREAISWVAQACADLRTDVALALDVAATHILGDDGRYEIHAEGMTLDAQGMTDLIAAWSQEFPIVSIEDGLAEDDWAGWGRLTKELGPRMQIVGDDLFATNPERLRLGIERQAANAVLVKINQIGTLTEALRVVEQAHAAGMAVVVSARSGETEDPFLSDFAVGVGADQIKVGSVTRSSRLSKWNQLLRIEEDLGPEEYVGAAGLRNMRSTESS